VYRDFTEEARLGVHPQHRPLTIHHEAPDEAVVLAPQVDRRDLARVRRKDLVDPDVVRPVRLQDPECARRLEPDTKEGRRRYAEAEGALGFVALRAQP